MGRHLAPVPDPLDHDDPAADEEVPLVRPAWWRWVAVAVVITLVVATPFVYALSRVLR